MIIAAFSLLTIQSVVGLVPTLSLPTDQIASLIVSVGEITTMLSSTVTAVAGALLFLGIFGLANDLKAKQNRQRELKKTTLGLRSLRVIRIG